MFAAIASGESNSFLSGSQFLTSNSLYGVRLNGFERSRVSRRCRFFVISRIKKGQKHEYPWPANIDPNLKSGHLNFLSPFKPLTDKPKPVTLEFEKPLIDLEKKIIDVSSLAFMLFSELSRFLTIFHHWLYTWPNLC